MEVYNDLKQSNSDNDKATKTSENPEKPAQAGEILGNLEENKTILKNLEEPVCIEKTLSKEKELENLEEPVYVRRTLSKPGKNVESVALSILKASALVIPAKNNDFDSLCILCIASKQIRAIM